MFDLKEKKKTVLELNIEKLHYTGSLIVPLRNTSLSNRICILEINIFQTGSLG